MLEELKLDAETIETIIEAHADTVKALKDKIKESDSKSEDYDAIKTEYEAVKKELEAVKSGDWENKYNKEHTEFEKLKADIIAKDELSAKQTAYKELLLKAGISDKRADAIIKVTKLDDIEVVDGKIKDAKTVSEKIAEEWSEFIAKTEKAGASTVTPPTTSGGGLTKEDIMKIKDASKRQKAIRENPELFGF